MAVVELRASSASFPRSEAVVFSKMACDFENHSRDKTPYEPQHSERRIVAGNSALSTGRRDQMKIEMRTLDQWLPSDHAARVVWEFVRKLDLSEFYADIKAIEGGRGSRRWIP